MNNLTSKLYSAMADGPSLHVTGQLTAGEHVWHVSVFLHQRPDGHWRIGRPGDSEAYCLNHVIASIPVRHGPNRKASNRDRRLLLEQIYNWIDKEFGYEPEAAGTTQAAPAPRRSNPMEDITQTRCAIFTKYGKGPQCPKLAAEGLDICKTHVYLEAKLGPLPRHPVVIAPGVSAVVVSKPVVAEVPAARIELAPAPSTETPAAEKKAKTGKRAQAQAALKTIRKKDAEKVAIATLTTVNPDAVLPMTIQRFTK
jgi:hypothetical protein